MRVALQSRPDIGFAPTEVGVSLDGIVDEHGDFIEFTGTAEQVDVLMTDRHVGAFALCHAADDAEDDVAVLLFFFVLGDDPDAAVDLLLSVFTNGTGVVEDDVSFLPIVSELVAEPCELAFDQLGVEYVHLAAERFEVNLSGCILRVSHGGVRWPGCPYMANRR